MDIIHLTNFFFVHFTKTMMKRSQSIPAEICPVEEAMKRIDGKWKLRIIYLLKDETLRYSDLTRKIPDITEKVLTTQLRQLEQDMIITRIAYPEVPLRVEYSLTQLGISLVPLIEAIYIWGTDYLVQTGNLKIRCPG